VAFWLHGSQTNRELVLRLETKLDVIILYALSVWQRKCNDAIAAALISRDRIAWRLVGLAG
jgi:hypothetical protein